MKAMILAAGFGTRFAPLTDKTPKPLLPLFNIPIIYHTLDWLEANGVKEVIVNLHHLADRLYGALTGRRKWGMKIAFSREEEILGTGGGLKRAAPFLGKETFILVNSDVFLTCDLAPALAFHRKRAAAATMLLARGDTRRYGALVTDRRGRLVSAPWQKHTPLIEENQGLRQGIFTGAHILEPEIFEYLEAGFNCVIKQGYSGMMDNDLPVCGYFPPPGGKGAALPRRLADYAPAPWYDLGEPAHYLNTHCRLLDKGLPRAFGYQERGPGIWLTAGRPGSVGRGVEIRPPVLLGKACAVEAGAFLGPYAILGDRCRIMKKAMVAKCVILPGAHIGEGRRVEGEVAA